MRHAKHPWLADIDNIGDADPANAAAVALANGEIHYVAPGSIPDQLGIRTQLHVPMTKARTEATLATSSERNWASRGAANEPTTVRGDQVSGNKAGI